MQNETENAAGGAAISCTIAIPVYNRAHLVRAAIESALAQDAEGLEILVIDNNSTDETWKTIQEFRDPRLRLLRNDTNIGLFGNLNLCLQEARGEYARILCSDDRLLPGCIARELAMLRQNPDVNLLSTAGRLVNTNGERIGTLGDVLPPGVYAPADAIIAGLWYLGYYEISPYNFPSGVMLRRNAALQAGGFDSAYQQLGDMDLWLKIARLGPIALTEDQSCEILIHDQQLTNQLLAQGATTREWFLVLNEFAPELKARGLYRRVAGQAAAGSAWFAFSFWRRGHRDAARQYWQVGRSQGVSLWRLAFAFVYHLILKILSRARILRLRPPLPPLRELQAALLPSVK